MADAATTRPQHLHLGCSALNPKGCSTSTHTHHHHHPTGETNTHVIFVVDICLGFEQYDGDIGMALMRSHHQRGVIILRARTTTAGYCTRPRCKPTALVVTRLSMDMTASCRVQFAPPKHKILWYTRDGGHAVAQAARQSCTRASWLVITTSTTAAV